MKKLLLVLIIVGCSNFDKIEIEEVLVSSEKVYFKKFSRGLNYEVIAISTNASKAEPSGQKDLLSLSGRRFYYRIKNDSLFIYDGHFSNKRDLGIAIVINSNMKVSEVLKIENDYFNNSNSSFKLFPKSHEKILSKKYQ